MVTMSFDAGRPTSCHTPEVPSPTPYHTPDVPSPTPYHTPDVPSPTSYHTPEVPNPTPYHTPEVPSPTPPARKSRSLPRMLSGEAVHPGAGARCSHGDREARVAVMGEAGVGKTAIVVRYITKRFIGDYAHYETTTSIQTTIDSKPTCLTILDTTGELDSTRLQHHMQWAEGFMLVFSVTSHDSFSAIQPIVEQITRSRDSKRPPIIIVGNKSDLCQVREVSLSTGRKLAKRLCCAYRETSASDSYDSVTDAFSCIFNEVYKTHAKQKKNGGSRIAQLKETLRSWTDFRVRTNTF